MILVMPKKGQASKAISQLMEFGVPSDKIYAVWEDERVGRYNYIAALFEIGIDPNEKQRALTILRNNIPVMDYA